MARTTSGVGLNVRISKEEDRDADSPSQLYEPYSDNPSSRGAMRIDPELLAKVVPKLLANGWQVVRSVFFPSPLSRSLLILYFQ